MKKMKLKNTYTIIRVKTLTNIPFKVTSCFRLLIIDSTFIHLLQANSSTSILFAGQLANKPRQRSAKPFLSLPTVLLHQRRLPLYLTSPAYEHKNQHSNALSCSHRIKASVVQLLSQLVSHDSHLCKTPGEAV